MMLIGLDWTRPQLEFIQTLTEAGATEPDAAVSLDAATRLPDSELQPLIDAGIVREAARARYYVYEMSRQQLLQAMAEEGQEPEDQPVTGVARIVRTIIFLVVVTGLLIAVVKVLQYEP